jgi:hypothetical protein
MRGEGGPKAWDENWAKMGGGGGMLTCLSLPSKVGGDLFSLSFSLAASPSSISSCFKFLMDFGRRSAAMLVADLAFLGLVGELLALSRVLGGLLESLSFPPKALSEMLEKPVFVGDGGG